MSAETNVKINPSSSAQVDGRKNPAPRKPRILTEEQKQANRLRARRWYEDHHEQRNAKKREAYREDPDAVLLREKEWRRKNPEKAAAIVKRSVDKKRDAVILAAPVIHDADRFERIAAVMASYKERKGEQQ